MTDMWMVRAGENAEYIDQFKKLNVVAIGRNLNDLSKKSDEEIKELMIKEDSKFENPNVLGGYFGQAIKFLRKIKIGDWVLSSNPIDSEYIFGKITSDYYYSKIQANNNNMGIYKHFRDVQWLGVIKREDLSQSSGNSLRSIIKLFNINNDVKNEVLNKYKIQKLSLTPKLLKEELEDFLIDDSLKTRLCASLNSGKHIIINGTPGTGKTELAQKFSKVAKNKGFNNGFILTTATSDWSTFDTIGGLMPNQKENGDILSFYEGKFLEAIANDKWLIIDEINRADIDKAFGQLFTVLSGQDVELPYKNKKGIPIKIKKYKHEYSEYVNHSKYDEDTATYYIGKNWRIIGTMNTDDKDSLFDLSYAFMRRFMFIEVDLPEDIEELIGKWCEKLKDNTYNDKLNKLYEIKQYRAIGPAIFKDMIEYIAERGKLEDNNEYNELIFKEAIESYIFPQLEGIADLDKIEQFFKKDLELDISLKNEGLTLNI